MSEPLERCQKCGAVWPVTSSVDMDSFEAVCAEWDEAEARAKSLAEKLERVRELAEKCRAVGCGMLASDVLSLLDDSVPTFGPTGEQE